MDLKNQFREWWMANNFPSRDNCINELRHKVHLSAEMSWTENITTTQIREWQKEFKIELVGSPDDEIVEENVKLARQKQYFQDRNRVERKSFREQTRIYNAIKEFNEELINEIKAHNLNSFTIKHTTIPSFDKVGIVHISDAHFNNLINLRSNKFDFEIASKRLQYLAYKAKEYFKANGITKVIVCSTGDLLNKDDILDKQLNNATNRAKATVLACHIVSQFLLDLNTDFNIDFFGVCGNESRLTEQIGYSDIVSSDSYDYTLLAMLYHRFLNSEGIKIHLSTSPLEQVINILGQNILLIHGHQMTGRDVVDSLSKILMKYLHDGISIDYVLSGHIHMAYLSDLFSRCSSLCGTDNYAYNGLHLNGRASQNLIVIDSIKNRDGIKVDLQNVPSDCEGYQIVRELEAYDIRGLDKMKKSKTIFKVII